MAKEAFDKEIQLLRIIFLTGGAYNRQQLAERLGISVHTFDKTLKKLKDIFYTLYPLMELNNEPFNNLQYYDMTDQLFLFLYRAKSVKESEVKRLVRILTLLRDEALTVKDLIERFDLDGETFTDLPDEKTLRQDLKYLEELDVIKKVTKIRPSLYRYNDDLTSILSTDELLDLYDFVHIMANTELPSVQGYILLDALKNQLQFIRAGRDLNAFLYKYHYFSRILDEYQAFFLFQAIQECKTIRFTYYTPKRKVRYESLNTNPLFAKETVGASQHTIPLTVIYDHQYGRWYLVAKTEGHPGLSKYRLEGITQLTVDGSVDADELTALQKEAEAALRHSWLIDTGHPVTVKLRFYHPDGHAFNFIHNRVELQGQWGIITEQGDEWFDYEIQVNDTMEIKPWIRSFGSSCEVLSPRSLRHQMIQEWKEIVGYYETESI
ncbi:helix-turn-helix transcriptional regulator [Brevibacillus dissolubilis]|uniref:helix-turn-helix transcriptional regulator n=1 Tax=Brevibacillus dissolubilis TaxID=1844116 RepID=UPI001116E52B|nr:WYL domain-containing protein [Brevibacillus dissolubilis]